MEPISRAILFIDELRKLEAEFPTPLAAVLLRVARDEGLSQGDAVRQTGMSKSAMERAYSRLSSRGYLGKPGLNLIDVSPDQNDARLRRARPTPLGKRVVQSLTALMDD
jgi:DNA-binding MarR family transcriptional regulator